MTLTLREIAIYLSLYFKGDWNQMYQVYVSKQFDFSDPVIIAKVRNLKCGALTIFDDNYPEYLKTVPQPPFVLFYYGDISLIHEVEKNISVVGTRNPTAYGVNSTREVVHELADHFVVVSGLAKGIDGIAHQSAIEVGGRTIAVLGSGIDYCYPIENQELYDNIKSNPNNLIISEYPEDTIPSQINFPLRNRFIAAFGRGLLITEAFRRSGTSITATFALELQKPIMVLPSEAFKESLCNKLISEGARLIDQVDDIYDEIGFRLF